MRSGYRASLWWALLVVGVLGASGCTSGSTAASNPATTTTTTLPDAPTSALTPVQEALSWFGAVNHRDHDGSLSHFTPEQRYAIANWNDGDTSQWPRFSDIHCVPQTGTSTDAVVRCTFRSTGYPTTADGAFWNISFHRDGSGPWLISGYGTA